LRYNTPANAHYNELKSLWITTWSHHLTTRVIHSLSGELRRNLLTILAAAIGGSGVRSAFIAQQHLLAASIFIDAVHESIGAGAALHAVAQLNKARVIHRSEERRVGKGWRASVASE